LSARLVVLVSGSGTNLAALLGACEAEGYGATVVAVGADRSDIEALGRAEQAGVPSFVCKVGDYSTRDDWDAALTDAVAEFEPDLVVSAGFMKILGKRFLEVYPTVNTHPSLLPAFPGAHAVAEAIEYGVRVTGATVHLVDAGIDSGPIVAQTAIDVFDGDDEQSLHERIKLAERVMLVDVVGRMARDGWQVIDRKVRLG
jgi:phosphoribosylglycinamide formyltransferase-1